MAVVWAREHWEGRDGSYENVVNNTLTRTWKVKTNNSADDSQVVAEHFKSALGIEFQSPHPTNGFFTARKLDIKQETASPTAWRVTVTYSTEPLEEEVAENPLNRAPVITGDSEMAEIFTTKDKDGKPVLNSAGDCLEPQEVDDPRGMIVIERNFPSVPEFVSTYINKVNSASFSVPGISIPFEPRTVKFQRFRFGAQQTQNEVQFVPVTVELSVKPDTWDVDRLDEGFHYLDGSDRKKITLSDGNDPTEPVPLNGSGGILASPTPDNAVYLTKKYYHEADFSVLFS